MKKLINIIGVVSLLISSTSCSDWLDVNKDPNSPTSDVVIESVLLPGIVSAVSYNLAGGYPARYTNAWIGQFAVNGEAPDIQTFRIMDTDVNNTWEYDLYANILKNSKLLTEQADVNGNQYYAGIGRVLTAYSLAIATDLWGDIPWSQALQVEAYPKPKYDSQEKVYEAIFEMLDKATENFAFTGDQKLLPGSDDLLFSGDITLWSKFAYSLKARYAMRLVYVKDAVSQANLVLSSLEKGIADNSEDADFAYFEKTGAENPWQQWFNKWAPMYLDKNIYTILSRYNDPRLELYTDVAYAEGLEGQIIPHQNGLLTTIAGETSKLAIERDVDSYDKGETVQPYFITKSSSLPFITFAEVCFLKAEAYLWKGDYDNAYLFVQNGTRANLEKMKLKSSDIESFISALPAIPSTFEEAQKMIIELKYVANFLSVENYNDYRRTHYPVIEMPLDAEYDVVPLRFPYPTSPKLYNSENVPTIAIDKDKVWWDKKN